MKILFLSHYFPPEGNAPATRTYEHTRRWVAQGHEVTVITCAPNVPHGRIYPGYKNHLYHWSQQAGIQLLRVWTYLAPNKGTARRSLNYASYLLSACIAGLFVKKPDVLVATSPQFFCGCAGALLAKWRGIPFILEIRDLWPDSITAVNLIPNPTALAWMLRLEQWLYRSAQHIVTVGKGYQRELEKKGVPAHKISVIPNGADLSQFQPRDKQKEATEKCVCSFIGTIGMAARLEIVVNAAKHLDSLNDDSIEFVLVGDGAELENLKKMAQASGTKRIRFTGLCSKEEVRRRLAETDFCLIHLKKTDLFTTVLPSKLFEAMASGIPVLMGVQGEAAEIVQASKCGLLFEPENHLDLCEKLMYLKAHPEASRQMGHNGRDHVEAHFNRDSLASRYESLLNTFLEEKGQRVASTMKDRNVQGN